MDKFWVGGTGNWSDATNHWALSSGGDPGVGNLPTADDNVFFDNLSNTVAYTVTIDTTTKLCKNLNFSAPASGDVTWAGSVAMTISGSMTLYAGLVRSYTGALTFNSTISGNTLNFAGKTMASATVFDGVGGEWTCNDAWNNGTSTITITRGSFITNNQTITCGSFGSNNSNTRSLLLGSSIINCTAWATSTINGLTFNCGTSSIRVTTTGGFLGGGLTFYEAQFNGTSHTISGNNTFATLSRTGTATKTDTLTISADQTIIGTLTLAGNSSINRLFIGSSTKGTAFTLSAGTVVCSNIDIQDIIGAGTGNWNLSAITGLSGDCGGNTNIVLTSPVTTNWISGTAFSTATWSVRVPLPQDTATFTTAGVVSIAQDLPRVGSIDFSTSSGKTMPVSITASIFGSIDLTNLASLGGFAQGYTLEGRGNFTFKSGGKTWGKPFVVNCATGTYTLGDDFTTGGNQNLTLTSGTFDAGSFNVTILGFIATGAVGRTVILGSGTWTIAGASTPWNISGSNIALTCGTSTIKMTSNSAIAKIFAGFGLTYYNFWDATTNTPSMTISGNNTFNDFKADPGRSLKFTTGSTQIVTTFSVNGTVGNEVIINSTTTGTHTIIKNGGGTVTCDYLNIQHSIVIPDLAWLATNSTNNQVVATPGRGWYFGAIPVLRNTNFFF